MAWRFNEAVELNGELVRVHVDRRVDDYVPIRIEGPTNLEAGARLFIRGEEFVVSAVRPYANRTEADVIPRAEADERDRIAAQRRADEDAAARDPKRAPIEDQPEPPAFNTVGGEESDTPPEKTTLRRKKGA